MKTVEILGVTIDRVAAPEALVRIRESLDRRKRIRVVTVNPEMVMRARQDPKFRALLNSADLRVADGIGLLWAAKFLDRTPRGPFKRFRTYLRAGRGLIRLALRPQSPKDPLPGTVPGSDLVRDLAGMGEEFGHRIYLLGAAPGVARRAAERLQEEFPGLRIAGCESGGRGTPAEDAAIVEKIRKAKPQVLLVAYTSPKQEEWLARNLSKLAAPVVGIGVGGSFDYLAGEASLDGGRPAKEPPPVVRRRGWEWLWRLFTQPSRWRRIAVAFPLFVSATVRDRLSRLDKNDKKS